MVVCRRVVLRQTLLSFVDKVVCALTRLLLLCHWLSSPTCIVASQIAPSLRPRNLFVWGYTPARRYYIHILSGFKGALLQNPREMIRAQIFSEKIRIQARKSELQAESRSYGPKVGDTAGQTPRIRTESPRKRPRMGFGCFCRKPPLKPSWIQRIHIGFWS